MVEYETALDATFAALSHPVRREMLDDLREGPMRVTDLAEPFTVSLAASSKHIKVLEHAGLVSRTVSGRDHVLTLQGTPLGDAGRWIGVYRQFWDGRLDALDAQLRARARR
ncbi:MAG: metalloregulator ArsR/SmtB family transcription factor [Candidatus Dormiibacterota bacterium]